MKLSILKGKSEVDMSQVVMKVYLPECFYFRVVVTVLFEDVAEGIGQLEGVGVVVVDRPVAFGHS